VTFVAQTVTIGEQKVCPESESLKFSTTATPQVENPSDSDSDSSTPTPQPCFKQTISCTVIGMKILNAKLILLSLGSPIVFISLKMKLVMDKILYKKYGPIVTLTARKYLNSCFIWVRSGFLWTKCE